MIQNGLKHIKEIEIEIDKPVSLLGRSVLDMATSVGEATQLVETERSTG